MNIQDNEVDTLKLEGNKAYTSKNYSQALVLYS